MPVDLEKLEELAKAATPGPWEDMGIGRIRTSNKRHELVADCAPIVIYGHKTFLKSKANAAYILAACNAMPELIAENRALRGKVQALEARIQEFTQLYPCSTIDFPNLRESVADTDNSLSDFLNESIKRAANRP